MNVNRKTLLYGAGAAGLLLYVKECLKVRQVLTKHEKLLASIDPTEKELKELEKHYADESAQVNFKDYQQQIRLLEENVAKGTVGLQGKDVHKVARESSAFLLGERAALLQLAHPYVAAGIAQHSNIKDGVQERFFNTFKHMFALTYGEWDEAKASSKTVRALHAKVKGVIDEDVGFFKKDHVYSANHLHALYWVYATLLEGVIFSYELFVGDLTEEEKTTYLLESKKLAQSFGIPEHFIADDWESFMRSFGVMLKSDVLTVSENAEQIKVFLIKPPSPKYAPLMKSVDWATSVFIPPKTGEQFYHRRITRWDRVQWILLNGYVRMIYRLLPTSLRWLTPYLHMTKRRGEVYTTLQEALMSFSARVANFFLAQLMPPRKSDTFLVA